VCWRANKNNGLQILSVVHFFIHGRAVISLNIGEFHVLLTATKHTQVVRFSAEELTTGKNQDLLILCTQNTRCTDIHTECLLGRLHPVKRMLERWCGMIQEYVADLAAQMGLYDTSVTIVDGALAGVADTHLLRLKSHDHLVNALLYQADIDSLTNGNTCDRLEVRIRSALSRLQIMLAP
jgi:hypothetical protein